MVHRKNNVYEPLEAATEIATFYGWRKVGDMGSRFFHVARHKKETFYTAVVDGLAILADRLIGGILVGAERILFVDGSIGAFVD